MIKKIVLSLAVFTSTLFSSNYNKSKKEYEINCIIPENIMFSLLLNEQTKKRSINYPFIIRFNYLKSKYPNKYEISKIIMDGYNNIQLDKKDPYAYDCVSLEQCIKTVEMFKEYNMQNLDLGPFQSNYFYYKYELPKYFNFFGSYSIACDYATSLYKKYGNSLDTYAKYHSKTKKYKEKYKGSLINNLKKIERINNDNK